MLLLFITISTLPSVSSRLVSSRLLGHAYAKALHYRELEFQTSPAACFESLININKKLDQYDAAIGVLKVVGQMQKKHPELVSHNTSRSMLITHTPPIYSHSHNLTH